MAEQGFHYYQHEVDETLICLAWEAEGVVVRSHFQTHCYHPYPDNHSRPGICDKHDNVIISYFTHLWHIYGIGT